MPICRTIGRLAAAMAVFACLAVPAAAEAPIPADARIAPDPAVKRGVLANGLRYAVMSNASPTGAVSIRLAMDVGSYDEEETELGFAHFIEHLAFRPTRQLADGAFDNRFAALGVALGRDQNAVTTLEATVYRIDLPSKDMGAVRAVLQWMRGAADGILFTADAVAVERGVVLAEKQSRESPTEQMQRDTARFQGPGLRSVNREPVGTEPSLRAATPAALQAFYERWYRPENGFLILVGDAPVAELERAVKEGFSSWAGKGAAGLRAAPPSQANERGLAAFTRANPALPSAVSACRLSPPDREPPATLQRLRRDAYSQLWTAILGKRLAHLAVAEDSALLGAAATVTRDIPDAMVACLIAVPTNDQWRQALNAAQAELRRFAGAGPTEREVALAVEEVRSRLRALLYQRGTRISSTLADQVADAELSGRVFQDPGEAMRTFDIAVDAITPDDVRKAFQADWSGSGPLLVASGAQAPAEAELVAAWTANAEAAPLADYADRAGAQWAYGRFGKKGKVKSREQFTNPDFARFHFANGVVLTFKHTDFQANGAEVRIRFGSGEKVLDQPSRLPVALAAGLFPMGGLGRMDFEQIASALANTSWSFTLGIETDAFLLSSSPMSEQVGQQLQLLAAYMTDPGFRSLMDDKFPTAMDFIYRSYRTDPKMVAVEALEGALYPGQPTLPPRDQLAAYRVSDFERFLKPVLTQSPIEVTIVGDMTEADAVAAVAKTFGALPKRAPLAPASGEGPFRRFPAVLPPPVRALHEGPAEKAAAVLVWPLYVASAERRSEEYAIGLVARIFEARLLQRVRVALGKAYSPSVADTLPDAADQGYVAAALEATPADLDQLVAAARRIASELAAGEISQQEVDAARDPLVAARLQAQSRNEAWAGILSHALRHPEAMDELLGYETAMKALTLDDVKRAAATWLARDPMVATAVPAAAAAMPASPR
jgi:zinc protease